MSPNNNYLQFVTYSGHNPFKLPEALQQIQLKGDYPERMRDYMIMANYTDKAIGIIVDYLKSRPDYENTLVVITGDHEGLAADRAYVNLPLARALFRHSSSLLSSFLTRQRVCVITR